MKINGREGNYTEAACLPSIEGRQAASVFMPRFSSRALVELTAYL